MKISLKFLPVLAPVLLISCSDNHLINNSQYLIQVENAFKAHRELAVNRDSALFTVLNQGLSNSQSEALKYLYAFMPLSDLADYTGSFFLANVYISLKARSQTGWGKNIPEDIFLHYVLPPRVNNENLDSFRIVFYDELMSRIRGKDIKEAALEINHWCHEKVTYQPADIRTSAPMSTILSARGRCGEESTLTVAALRTVGIPARQVYTPRWAHTDDNHAWVEIWSNGNWNYMGACEPESVLDRGWFTEPARRAMLVHTKSFGAYLGQENVITRHRSYTDVNNLAKYAITKTVTVKVIDRDDLPVRNAAVEYQIYNYAEFYPLAVVPTDDSGISRFETGFGDLLIWARKDDYFAFRKSSAGETDTLILKLTSGINANESIDLDLNVPPVLTPLKGPSQDLMEKNSVRIEQEDLIRRKYVDSWIKSFEIIGLSVRLNVDSVRLKKIISRSMGNYNEILLFLEETQKNRIKLAMSLLEILPDKDLRDTKASILSDHIMNCSVPDQDINGEATGMFQQYILNPRIANEMLVAWRGYFRNKLPALLVRTAPEDPSLVIQYINNSIKIVSDENYYNTPLTPVGVNELKVADNDSRSVCFVAICRSLGIPARLEEGTGVPQYYFNNNWNDVCFSDQKKPELVRGYIRLLSVDPKLDPEYHINFTLARFADGRYNTLEYDFNKKLSGFDEKLSLLPGRYMLVTGNRISDSKILSNIMFFDLSENEHKTVGVKIRKDTAEMKILGSIDLKKILVLPDMTDAAKSCIRDKGIVISWIDPATEPGKHILNDLSVMRGELETWNGRFLFLEDPVTGKSGIDRTKINTLPLNSSFGTDKDLTILRNSLKLNIKTDINLPVVVVCDHNGNILYLSAGYKTGIGEEVLKFISHLN